MTVSNLSQVSVPAYIGNYTQGRNGAKIRCVTIHHMAGVMSAEGCGGVFKTVGRRGSAHYGVGNDGRIGSYVDESNIAWTNSNWSSNCESVTIEVSNSAMGGNWPVSDAAWNALIKLVADIAKRNNLGMLVPGKNLTWHSMFVATSCPGDYQRAKMQELADKVNSINGILPLEAEKPKKSNEEVADEIVAGKGGWGNWPERQVRLEAAGYNYSTIQGIVTQKIRGIKTPARKSEAEIADEVLRGICSDPRWTSWGEHETRWERFEIAGYNAKSVQDIINAKVRGTYSNAAPVVPKPTQSISKGCKVVPIQYVAYNGVRLRKTRDFYYVQSDPVGSRVVLCADSPSGVVYAAMRLSNLKKV